MGCQVIWNCSKILCSNMTITGHRQARQVFIAPLQFNSASQAIMIRHSIYYGGQVHLAMSASL